MRCRSCGTEIAEKALICFRCGTATTEAVHKPVPIGVPRWSTSDIATLIALDLIALVGVYVGFTADSDATRLAGWALFGVGTLLVVWQVVSHRR
jgi:hypothetical protein